MTPKQKLIEAVKELAKQSEERIPIDWYFEYHIAGEIKRTHECLNLIEEILP